MHLQKVVRPQQGVFPVQGLDYRIEGNFRGVKYSWLKVWPRIFYPRMKRPCLSLPAVQAPTTKILPTKCLNIVEPRIFYPPKITRYTVFVSHSLAGAFAVQESVICLWLYLSPRWTVMCRTRTWWWAAPLPPLLISWQRSTGTSPPLLSPVPAAYMCTPPLLAPWLRTSRGSLTGYPPPTSLNSNWLSYGSQVGTLTCTCKMYNYCIGDGDVCGGCLLLPVRVL